MSCPICQRRKPKRFCPAKGESICAVCCGTEREVTFDCPSHCPHLLTARRYEDEHPREHTPEEIPFPDVELTPHFIRERQPVISGLGFTILKFARENTALSDADVLAALQALAETYRTLGSGIYYEKPPQALLPRGLYAALQTFLQQLKTQEAERTGFPSLKDAQVFRLLVFLLRVGKHRSNGRPRSRAFLDFLRAHYPKSPEIDKEAPRIVIP